jgi:membrane-associated phospholipid phosphatase
MQLDKHHPIDVTVGAIIGTVCGLSFAGAVPGAASWLRRNRHKSSRDQASEAGEALR